jgi:carbon storage regulator CsrA
MLVLTRKEGEKVLISCDCGQECVVTLLNRSAGKLGFIAPESTVIIRSELADVHKGLFIKNYEVNR